MLWELSAVSSRPDAATICSPAYNAVPLLSTLDSLLLGTAFSIAHIVLTSPLLQLPVLLGSLWIAGLKYLITCSPKLLWTALSVLFNPDSLPPPRTPQHLQESTQPTTLDQLLHPASSSSSKAATARASGASGVAGTSSGVPHAAGFGLGDVVRTPAECFEGLASVGFPFAPHYFEFQGLRLHYLDEPPAKAAAERLDTNQPETLLLLHGNPTWSFLYRHVIPHLTGAGFRVLALDFAGFGRSDKPLEESDITTELNAASVVALLNHLDVTNATLVMHDWSAIYMMWCLPSLPTGRIGRLVVLNAALPPHPLLAELGLANSLLVAIWMASVAIVGRFMPVLGVMKSMVPSLPLPQLLGYAAPFPSHKHKAAVVRAPRLAALAVLSAQQLAYVRSWGVMQLLELAMPGLCDVLDNTQRDMKRGQQARTWIRAHWNKPTLLLFGAPDPLFGSMQHLFALGIFNPTALAYCPRPVIIESAGHYLTETQPARVAIEVTKFVLNT